MIRLALILYAMIGTTLAGTLMVAALTAGYTTTQPVVWAAVLGFVLGIPVAYFVAREITNRG
ncbi:MAG: CTP synthetase [Dinoroseobacter sp.]|nr:CTP synthetase [Dinoroseobacter sp.]MDJ0993669.1 CTP synthetase [Dinoroseobacter sp.]